MTSLAPRRAVVPKADPRPDAELLAAAQDDPECFGIFYDRHIRSLLSYCYRRTADAQAAADVAAETFATAFAIRGRFDPAKGEALAWLYGIAANHVRHLRRRHAVDERARQQLGIQPTRLDHVSTGRIEEIGGDFQYRAAVQHALGQLSSKLAKAVELRVVADLPYEEVARRLGCSEGTARVRVTRGLAKLATALEELR